MDDKELKDAIEANGRKSELIEDDDVFVCEECGGVEECKDIANVKLVMKERMMKN